MSFYDNDVSWSGQSRQTSWEQQPPPSRSGAGSAMSNQSDSNAFASQFEEIERATDNLMKSGKWYPGAVSATRGVGAGGPARRESLPGAGRGFDYSADPRSGSGPSRHQSVSDLEGPRPGSAGLQGYFAGQRFPGGRQSEAEQVLQAKRRMAAQRERELRNYHQEQQYNRTAVTGVKTDRALSPATMSEEDRRDLIARQHRALYGDNANMYNAGETRGQSQDARGGSSGRGPSPLAFDPFGVQAQAGAEGAVQMPPRDRADNTASPVSNPPAQQAFGHLSETQQSSRTSNSSPGTSPPLTGSQKGIVAPIGTRPAPGSTTGMGKRSTTPLTPSSLSYGFNASDSANASAVKDERSTSASSKPPVTADKNVSGLGNWGSNTGGGWGPAKNSLAVQPSVWG